MLRTFIQITAIFLTLESAIFLCRGNLTISPKFIADIATIRYSYNPQLIKNLSAQHADTWIGIVLLITAFILQLSNSLWEMRIDDFGVSRAGVLLSIAISMMILIGCFYVSNVMAKRHECKALDILNNAKPVETQMPTDSKK